ncbi:MAG: cell division protein FtsZ [Tannerellaceae bacterium]|jgi:cell division protein FtsZ|nr:cell division protein FtsZ [Tannerellaceae bacterium]
MDDSIEDGFVLTTENPKIIKVIGVGGGGGNAVSHMYDKGIGDVTFLLCNTDKQDLEKSKVPDKLVLGNGEGAGGDPEKARLAAIESKDEIGQRLSDGTKMVFITAGMGGGTGTGAAPIIANIAKNKEILTVSIVTIPFIWEGRPRVLKALKGVEEMRKNVDAILVICNDRLLEVFDDDDDADNGFAKADDTLHIAAKSIAELITVPGKMNLDLADVKATLCDSGVALISNGHGEGATRLQTALDEAVNSPLLNNNNIYAAQRMLLNVATSKQHKLSIKEVKEIGAFMARFDQTKIETKWGRCDDDTLGNRLKVTILASGFSKDAIPDIDIIDKETAEKEEEIKENEQKLIGKYYGEDFTPTAQLGIRFQSYILAEEDLDNDEIIVMLENTPAYKQDYKTLKKLKTQRDNAKAKWYPCVSAPVEESGRSDQAISF